MEINQKNNESNKELDKSVVIIYEKNSQNSSNVNEKTIEINSSYEEDRTVDSSVNLQMGSMNVESCNSENNITLGSSNTYKHEKSFDKCINPS